MADEHNYIRIEATLSNCNMSYVTGLACYPKQDMVKALQHILTVKVFRNWDARNDVRAPEYNKPQSGVYLFAQGSEDNVETRPYGPKLKQLIEDEGLGTVVDSGPAPNPYHRNKPGIVYVWAVNTKACKRWWDKHVKAPWDEQHGKTKKVRKKVEKKTAEIKQDIEG